MRTLLALTLTFLAASATLTLTPAAGEAVPTQWTPVAACEEIPLTGPGATPVATCSGIRPGAPVTSSATSGAYCTYSWALTDGTDTYITTAGHCVSEGRRVATRGIGTFGTVIASTCGFTPLFETCEPGQDYALVKVDADKAHLVTNDQCAFGPVTSIFTERDLVPREVTHHGYGLGPGNFDATRARVGVATYLDGLQDFGFAGVVSFGDSGSAAAVVDPVTGERQALGIITHLAAATSAHYDPRETSATGTRLDYAVSQWEARFGVELELVAQ